MPLTNKAGQPIETKPVAGLSTNAVIGYAIALAFALWPGVFNHIPADLRPQLPVVIGTLLGAVAAYYAKHTSRPDIIPVEVQPTTTTTPQAPPVGQIPGSAQ